MGNTFGKIFRITTFGESHGKGIGVVIDGCPPGVQIDYDFIQSELSRRKPGQSRITTARKESDEFEIQSGIFEGRSTGTPISIFIPNQDQRSKDYSHIKDKYRPSHADYTYQAKYGLRDYRGGGRSSARETAARVAAGAVAKLILKDLKVEVIAFVCQVGEIVCDTPYYNMDLSLAETNEIRCPDPKVATEMIQYIQKIKKAGDSVGGVIKCVISGVPAGLGTPVFDKLHADLGKAMLSINAVKGFEYGSGFEGSKMLGSQHNDEFVADGDSISTKTNYSGGIQGGISNGQDIYMNIAFKPVATIIKDQESINEDGETVVVKGKGRHDPCVVPRAVPIVEAMAALVLLDHYLQNQTLKT